MSTTSNDPQLDDRVTELEVRLSFQDAQIETLNKVIIEQRNEVDALRAELQKIKEQLLAAGQVDPAIVKPPHY